MRTIAITILGFFALPLAAQTPRRPIRSALADSAESAIRQASDQLRAIRKVTERDVEVLNHLRTADSVLTDPMQPTNAVLKAYEEVEAARVLQPELVVYQGVVKMKRELESAKLSPMTPDFGHLRAVMAEDALGPARRGRRARRHPCRRGAASVTARAASDLRSRQSAVGYFVSDAAVFGAAVITTRRAHGAGAKRR